MPALFYLEKIIISWTLDSNLKHMISFQGINTILQDVFVMLS